MTGELNKRIGLLVTLLWFVDCIEDISLNLKAQKSENGLDC